jgi:hypothetical protein
MEKMSQRGASYVYSSSSTIKISEWRRMKWEGEIIHGKNCKCMQNVCNKITREETTWKS